MITRSYAGASVRTAVTAVGAALVAVAAGDGTGSVVSAIGNDRTLSSHPSWTPGKLLVRLMLMAMLLLLLFVMLPLGMGCCQFSRWCSIVALNIGCIAKRDPNVVSIEHGSAIMGARTLL